MDTLKEYIKMCRKAYKFLGKPKQLGLTNLWHEKIRSDLASPFLLSEDGDDNHFPVYRQDQLQAMMKTPLAKTLRDFFVFMMMDYNDKQPMYLFNSWEQF